MASPAVAASITAHLEWLDRQIEEIMAAVQLVITEGAILNRNQALLLSIPSIGVVTASALLTEIFNISGFYARGISGFHRSLATRTWLWNRSPRRISRTGSERLRQALYMCTLSSKRRDPALDGFMERMTTAGKLPKVILTAVARKLLILSHTIVQMQELFTLLVNDLCNF